MKLDPVPLDAHTHTIASGHAYGTITEMIHAAQEKHMKILGISEHAPGIPGTCDQFYFCNFKVIPRQYGDLRLIMGSEINILQDGSLSLIDKYIHRLDYGIAGIHIQCYKDMGVEQNTKNVIQAMRHPKISIISHPDDDTTPLDYDKLTDAAKEYGVALEVNNSALRYPRHHVHCIQNYKTMLALCKKKNTPIILDSDAHHPCDVGAMEKIEAFFEQEEIDFPRELILNYNLALFEKICLKDKPTI